MMSSVEFAAWAAMQDGPWELHDGIPVSMSPERVTHADTKLSISLAFTAAIRTAGLTCRFLPDGVLVPIDDSRRFQPDGLVYCGQRADGNALEIPNPVIVIEVLSLSTATRDLRDKLVGYFIVPSIVHYLIVDPDKQMVIHHRRAETAIETRVVANGAIKLEPPGLEVEFSTLMPQ
jgi:Uma2 family endonuclease